MASEEGNAYEGAEGMTPEEKEEEEEFVNKSVSNLIGELVESDPSIQVLFILKDWLEQHDGYGYEKSVVENALLKREEKIEDKLYNKIEIESKEEE